MVGCSKTFFDELFRTASAIVDKDLYCAVVEVASDVAEVGYFVSCLPEAYRNVAVVEVKFFFSIIINEFKKEIVHFFPLEK